MQVRCEKCKGSFDFPLKEPGNIEYSHCKSVFRVTYKFRTSCPECRTLLQLTPAGRNKAIGIALAPDAGEKTEMLELSLEGEATIPRSSELNNLDSPVPTVRVTKTKIKKPTPFLYLPQDLKIKRPVHFAIHGSKSRQFPILRILLLGIIVLSTALTVGLTLIALRSGKTAVKPKQPHKVSTTATEVSKKLSEKSRSLTPEEEKEAAFYVPRLEKVTSKFGKRLDPITLDRMQHHHGLDIAAPKRAEIVAALEGTVRFTGSKGGYGNIIVIDHEDGYETLYGHLDKILVKKGKKVKQGDLIGLAGSTGRSTGTHLHFELRKDGRSVDPYRVELMSRVSRNS